MRGMRVSLVLASVCSQFIHECNFALLVVVPKYLKHSTVLKGLLLSEVNLSSVLFTSLGHILSFLTLDF